jgi:hypothetical protein
MQWYVFVPINQGIMMKAMEKYILKLVSLQVKNFSGVKEAKERFDDNHEKS